MFKLLFICNNEETIRLFQEVLDKTDKIYELLIAKTADEAENMLEYRSKHFIDLIFSEYTGQDTLGLLSRLKSDPYLRRIPVIAILGTEEPLTPCYKHQANCCIVDNNDPEIFKSLIEEALKYWTNVIALPDSIISY